MQPFTALLILVACQHLDAHQYSRTPQNLIKDSLHSLLRQQSSPVKRIVTCSRTLGVSKCLSALGVWRAERALRALSKNSTVNFNLTEDVEQFPWKEYSNETNEQLQVQLLGSTQRLLRYRPLKFDMLSGYIAKLTSRSDGSLSIDVYRNEESEGRTSLKQIEKKFYKFAPMLLAPGLFLYAIIPFILPSLKMMILMVGLMNKIALIGAIFTILRNNAFDDKYNHRVVYDNEGYKNEKLKFSSSNNEEHFHTNHLGFLYDDYKTPELKPIVNSPLDENYGNFEVMHSVKPEWIKDYTDSKVLSLIGNQSNEQLFLNEEIPIQRSTE